MEGNEWRMKPKKAATGAGIFQGLAEYGQHPTLQP